MNRLEGQHHLYGHARRRSCPVFSIRKTGDEDIVFAHAPESVDGGVVDIVR